MFATAIVQSRSESGISQERLAELTGLSTSYISLLERGQRNLTVLTASQIAEAFGLRLSEFFAVVELVDAKK
ncbi:MAG: XRE family transcriptional regulator [Comamonadaceae bacterium]|nr:MAG: XRE family transcriptional regulator [Comamonadaceae bacterium]